MIHRTRYMSFYVAIAACILMLSQGIGYWVNNNIELNTTVEFNRFIHFTHIRNYGGVFGLFQGMGWVFTLISATLLLAVTLYLWKNKTVHRYEFICFGFIVGGGASNILDRHLYGSVIDFIDIQHIPFWNYIFNTADVMVHIGIWPLLLISFFADSNLGDSHDKGPLDTRLE